MKIEEWSFCEWGFCWENNGKIFIYGEDDDFFFKKENVEKEEVHGLIPCGEVQGVICATDDVANFEWIVKIGSLKIEKRLHSCRTIYYSTIKKYQTKQNKTKKV